MMAVKIIPIISLNPTVVFDSHLVQYNGRGLKTSKLKMGQADFDNDDYWVYEKKRM